MILREYVSFVVILTAAPSKITIKFMTSLRKYYTYAFLREDGTPYYIGKGLKKRVYVYRSKGARRPTDKNRILILKSNLTEEEAFKHEIYMIAIFGRKDLGTGILHNRTNGGEGCSGRKCSPETGRKIAEAISGESHPQFGKKWWNNPSTGEEKPSKRSPGPGWEEGRCKKFREAVSEKKKGKPQSEEHRIKNSECRRGPKNQYYGKKRPDHSKKMKGRTWWVNPQGEIKYLNESPGSEWQNGRVYRKP
jgi:hypothetical protein